MAGIPLLRAGDTLVLRKKHPCGGDRFALLRVGAEVRLRCETCRHDMVMDRLKLEKAIKQHIPGGSAGQKGTVLLTEPYKPFCPQKDKPESAVSAIGAICSFVCWFLRL